ncbi:MAG: ABC transporter ATP-binding protein [Thermoplasmatota archaeon]
MMSAYLELRNIRKSFGPEKVLKGIDLSVERDSILAVLGPSGCGKSTMLRIISGLVPQDRGEVIINGKEMTKVPVSRRKVGFVFQDYSLFPSMSVSSNIQYGMKVNKVPRRDRKERLEQLLELTGLSGLETRKPFQLSGGQQQRVALARALAVEPELLLLDEPFGALDARIRKRIRRDLKRIQDDLGFTAVFVTHDQEEAFELGDSIAVMHDGRIEQVGRPRDLYERPGTDFVAGFIGSVNVIELPASGGAEPVTVMIRPEDVRIDPFSGAGISGTVMSYNYLGPVIDVTVQLDNGDDITSLISRERFMMAGIKRRMKVGVRITRFCSFKKDVNGIKSGNGLYRSEFGM